MNLLGPYSISVAILRSPFSNSCCHSHFLPLSFAHSNRYFTCAIETIPVFLQLNEKSITQCNIAKYWVSMYILYRKVCVVTAESTPSFSFSIRKRRERRNISKKIESDLLRLFNAIRKKTCYFLHSMSQT